MTIRKQLFISFISSIVISTLFLLILYKMMWFDVHQTLVLTAFSLISSLITVMIAMTFLVPTIHRLEKLNLQTQKVSEGHFNIEKIDIHTPRELSELNDSFHYMVERVQDQMVQIQEEQTEKVHMVQNLAHDLKTPLASIKSYSEALKDGVIQGQEAKRHAHQVLITQSERLSQMFDDLTAVMTLSDASRPQSAIQIDQLLIPIFDAFQQRIEHEHRQLDLRMPKQIPRFKQDKVALERIISNLIDNALKFSHSGTPIIVEIEEDDKHQISISVIDQGIGIAKEDIPHIFDRTYRVEQSRNLQTGGSGLGLYIAQSLAAQIGAHIEVESELGTGTKMTVRFSIIEETK
ncbi:sensor histidine kinase [Staphylococcus pettenkoferi]|uniref:sensor histidine kinase n=1 Tax=Staphylococcus pettenkoferi TaxID=170573 RepID=UPI00066ADFE2|nr:HAMP domain-containing sensor histidine kinase [Staphylococcus pettenkoferi]MDK7114608.1 HAMP domain-containing sensor histidine kinase [Staphylococcus pettenkoferi]MDK7283445.1 HAMP domain-containing sensor histidine kinase [Staphylococcus pettenkoferi]